MPHNKPNTTRNHSRIASWLFGKIERVSGGAVFAWIVGIILLLSLICWLKGVTE